MIKTDTIQNIYFIGIGGIGMSALARYFKSKGAMVSGYDKTRTALTIQLEEEGMVIHYEENIDLISKEAQVVVYTPAIPSEHAELVWYLQNNYTVIKRSDLLEWITLQTQNICISGTHGKTTTTTMAAHLLRHSNYGCNAFLGGISANYQTNFWSSSNNTVVVEADEYDRSFLKLHPFIAVITAVDPDHLDIYKTAAAFEEAFIEFAQKIKAGGWLITKYGLTIDDNLNNAQHITYSLNNSNADVFADNISIKNGIYQFNVKGKIDIPDCTLAMGGLHNIENALAAICVASVLKIDPQKIKNALADFKGVKRRFEFVLNDGENILIDDYAHHPQELKALISGVKNLFPDQTFTLVFQPHLYSRTADQADGFAEVLKMADELILLPVYPAREKPIEGVSSEMILQRMNHNKAMVKDKNELISYMKRQKPGLVVMAGAGDIDALVEGVKQALKAK